MKKILKKLKPYKIHIFSWILFITGEVAIVGLASGGYGKLGNYVFHYSLNISLFYICGEIIYPKIFRHGLNWIWRLPLGLTAIFAIYLLVNFITDLQITLHTSWNDIDDLFIDKQFIFRTLWRAIQFMGYAGLYYLFKEYQKEIRNRELANEEIYRRSLENKNMELSLNQAKNSYLKAQINPHLLFNTLNFLYQDLQESAPKSAEIVMTLSDVMRYSVNNEFEEATVPLANEIEQVENLIKLHLSRFEGERYIQFSYDEIVKTIKFIPLILITLVENVFKHGKLSNRDHPAYIEVRFQNGTLVISTRNLIDKARKIPSLHKGINNIEQRIAFAYGESATFDYENHDGFFSARLSVPLS